MAITSLSGKVQVSAVDTLDSSRYEYLSLDQAEPNLGAPESDGSLVISNINRERYFTTNPYLSGLNFRSGRLDEVVLDSTDPAWYLVLKSDPTLPGDDSVGWTLGKFEEKDTLKTVTDRGNFTDNDIIIANLLADSATFNKGVRILGNLWVDGTQTTINSTELTVDDKNIIIAQGAVDSISADGAGITVDGATASMNWYSASGNWTFSHPIDADKAFIRSSLFFDGDSDGEIRNIANNFNQYSSAFYFRDQLTEQNLLYMRTGLIDLFQPVEARDSATFFGPVYLKDVPYTDSESRLLFRRPTDGQVVESTINLDALGNIERITTIDTDSDFTCYPVFTFANGGLGGFDSAYIDALDFQYNPGQDKLTVRNFEAVGFTDLDSTRVEGDISIGGDPTGITRGGRLLDSAGRSFVIYDSSGQLLWGNNGVSAGNLGGPQAIVSNLEDLGNVEITSLVAGQIIKYDGVKWVNAADNTGAGGSGIALTDLSVDQKANSGTGLLEYNNLTGVFSYTPPAVPSLLGLSDVNSDGTPGQVLATDGNGNFSFVDPTGGSGATNAFTNVAVSGEDLILADQANDTLTFAGTGGITITTNAATDTVTIDASAVVGTGGSSLQSRKTISVTTTTIAPGTTVQIDLDSGAPTYALLEIEATPNAWVRVYTDSLARTIDQSRTIDEDPDPVLGVVTEIATATSGFYRMAPGIIGWTRDGSNTIPLSVTNKSTTTSAITVTMKIFQLEE
jgi:hypothetical protein